MSPKVLLPISMVRLIEVDDPSDIGYSLAPALEFCSGLGIKLEYS